MADRRVGGGVTVSLLPMIDTRLLSDAPEATAAHLKAAMGKANARDKATLARFAAIKAVDAE